MRAVLRWFLVLLGRAPLGRASFADVGSKLSGRAPITVSVDNPVKFDDASWHTEGEFPNDLPEAAASTHIRAFVVWCIRHDLVSDEFRAGNESVLATAKTIGWMSDDDLGRCCDGKLISEDFTPEGEAFALSYYRPITFHYLADYESLTADYSSIYHAPDDPSWFATVAEVISRRFEDWKQTGRTR